MKELVFSGIRVPARRAKWALFTAALGGISFVFGSYLIYAFKAGHSSWKLLWGIGLIFASQLFALAAWLILAPMAILPVALVLAPLFIATFAMKHEPWAQWWFWPATALCEITGGY